LTHTNPFDDITIQTQNLEFFFIIVILARWLLPKGKITLEELSKLLLIYMSVIADILDIMKMIRTIGFSKCEQSLKNSFFTFSLTILSISILQLCLSLTAKRSSTSRLNEKIDIEKINAKYKAVASRRARVLRFKLSESSPIEEEPQNENSAPAAVPTKNTKDCFYNYVYLPSCKCQYSLGRQVRKMFEKEVWGICLSLLIKDIPFSIVRTYALIAPPRSGPNACFLWSQSLFFQLKNYLTIVIQLNRCYVLYNLNEDNSYRPSSGSNEQNKKKDQNGCRKNQNQPPSPPPPTNVATISSSVFSTSPSSSNNTLGTLIKITTTTTGDNSQLAALDVRNLDDENAGEIGDSGQQALSAASQEIARKRFSFWRQKVNRVEVENIAETPMSKNVNLDQVSSKRNTLTVNRHFPPQRSSIISVTENSSISQGPLIF
jgi:hypothetical protein